MTTAVSSNYNLVLDHALSLPVADRIKLVACVMASYDSADTNHPLPKMTMSEINARIDRAEAEIKAGQGQPIENLFAELESKYPWLCE